MQALKSKFFRLLIFLPALLILSSGPICMAYMTTSAEIGFSFLWLTVPLAGLTVAAFIINDQVLYPRYVVTERYIEYFIAAIIVSGIINFASIYIEMLFRALCGVPQEIRNPFSPWILIYSIPTGLFMAMIIVGFSLWKLRSLLESRAVAEKMAKEYLEQKAILFRKRLRMEEIRRILHEAMEKAPSNPDKTNSLLRNLSERLRQQLYDTSDLLPPPSGVFTTPPPNRPESISVRFMASPRLRPMRHLALILFCLFVAFGSMFDFPDRPVFDVPHLLWAATAFLITAFLIYMNIYILFPLFKKKGRERIYAWILGLGTMLLFSLLTIYTMMSSSGVNPQGVQIPIFTFPLGTAGTLMTFLVLMAGTFSLAMINNNIKGKWRISRLEMEVARAEFENLQHQVSPHFIFNVLNNAAILSFEEPEEAVETLRRLEIFLVYHLEEARAREITIAEEVAFLSNYLIMERASGKNFDFRINYDRKLGEIRMPTLLTLPIVENAVKHSGRIADRWIEINISRNKDKIRFECRNSFSQESREASIRNPRKSGLGIVNTRRRLELLFGKRFSFESHASGQIYSSIIIIPLS